MSDGRGERDHFQTQNMLKAYYPLVPAKNLLPLTRAAFQTRSRLIRLSRLKVRADPA
jgi:hypothetical protein